LLEAIERAPVLALVVGSHSHSQQRPISSEFESSTHLVSQLHERAPRPAASRWLTLLAHDVLERNDSWPLDFNGEVAELEPQTQLQLHLSARLAVLALRELGIDQRGRVRAEIPQVLCVQALLIRRAARRRVRLTLPPTHLHQQVSQALRAQALHLWRAVRVRVPLALAAAAQLHTLATLAPVQRASQRCVRRLALHELRHAREARVDGVRLDQRAALATGAGAATEPPLAGVRERGVTQQHAHGHGGYPSEEEEELGGKKCGNAGQVASRVVTLKDLVAEPSQAAQ
jgi:hypothetical protein